MPIGTGQREMKFPVRGILTGISFGKWGILFNGSNAIQAGGFGCISFAGEYHLPVCSLEHKLEFAILTGTYDKFSHGRSVLGSSHEYTKKTGNLHGDSEFQQIGPQLIGAFKADHIEA